MLLCSLIEQRNIDVPRMLPIIKWPIPGDDHYLEVSEWKATVTHFVSGVRRIANLSTGVSRMTGKSGVVCPRRPNFAWFIASRATILWG